MSGLYWFKNEIEVVVLCIQANCLYWSVLLNEWKSLGWRDDESKFKNIFLKVKKDTMSVTYSRGTFRGTKLASLIYVMCAFKCTTRVFKDVTSIIVWKFITPCTKILVEWCRITKHAIHHDNIRYIPSRDIFIESCRIFEQLWHVDYLLHIPRVHWISIYLCNRACTVDGTVLWYVIINCKLELSTGRKHSWTCLW